MSFLGIHTKDLLRPGHWHVASGIYNTSDKNGGWFDPKSAKASAKGTWDNLTGKSADDAEKQRIADAHKAQAAVTNSGLQANNTAVAQSQKMVQAGTNQAAGYLGQGYDQARQDMSSTPNRMADLYNGGLQSGFASDPGYQFRLQQGQGAAAATGGNYDQATLDALSAYNQGSASNEFQNYAQRQMGMAGGADQADLSRNAYLGNAAMQNGQGQAALYSGQGNQLAGLNMQGTGLNTGVRQTAMNALSPAPQQPQGPNGMQQALGLGAMYLGSQAPRYGV